MSGDQFIAVTAGFLGLRWWYKSWRIQHHTRARDRHDAAAWRHMRGGKR